MARPYSRPSYAVKAKKMLPVAHGQPGANAVALLTEALMKFTFKDKPDAFRFLDLPDELKDSVLDHVTLISDLRSLSQVSKRLKAFTLPHLYRTVVLYDHVRIRNPLLTFKGDHPGLEHIRNLRITGLSEWPYGEYEEDHLIALLNFITTIPRNVLRTFELSGETVVRQDLGPILRVRQQRLVNYQYLSGSFSTSTLVPSADEVSYVTALQLNLYDMQDFHIARLLFTRMMSVTRLTIVRSKSREHVWRYKGTPQGTSRELIDTLFAACDVHRPKAKLKYLRLENIDFHGVGTLFAKALPLDDLTHMHLHCCFATDSFCEALALLNLNLQSFCDEHCDEHHTNYNTQGPGLTDALLASLPPLRRFRTTQKYKNEAEIFDWTALTTHASSLRCLEVVEFKLDRELFVDTTRTFFAFLAFCKRASNLQQLSIVGPRIGEGCLVVPVRITQSIVLSKEHPKPEVFEAVPSEYMERRGPHTMDELQPLFSKMAVASASTYGATAPPSTTYTEHEKVLLYSQLENDDSESAFDGKSFVSHIRNNLLKAASAAIAIGILATWWFWSKDLAFTQEVDITSIHPKISPKIGPRASQTSLLEVFQISPPVLTVAQDGTLEITDDSSDEGAVIVGTTKSACEEVLVVHSFAYSYGQPFISSYTPPICKFNRVTWNLTVVSAGRQFDRLGIVYLGDIEVFRTSTAEPTANGIKWTYLKDMTNYLSLFKQDQKLIFDLGNLIDDVYTGAFNVTLTGAFFTVGDSESPADLIIPVSKRSAAEDSASVFNLDEGAAINSLTIPRNTKKAVFTIAATGQSSEEFWWSNVPQSETQTFPQAGTLPGFSPFREAQLLIDGSLAGVAWPFPIIFTGGVVPGLWRPIVGIDAFDLKEDEIDITPWLPLLCDGNAHTFEIRVSGLNDSSNAAASLSDTTASYWLVTGKVFIWLDVSGHITTGQGPSQVTPAPALQLFSSITKGANGTNETIQYQVNAQRSLSFQSTIKLSSGKQKVSWYQQRSFSNAGELSEGGNVGINTQQTTGYDISSTGYARKFTYDLYVSSVYETLGTNISIIATVNRDKEVQTIGQAVFPTGLEAFTHAAAHKTYPKFDGSLLSTTQNGTATYLANTTSSTSFSYGTTEQDMTLSGLQVGRGRDAKSFPKIGESEELFHRHALAVNGTVVSDEETIMDETVQHGHGHEHGSDGRGFCIKKLPGRGGHWHDMSP